MPLYLYPFSPEVLEKVKTQQGHFTFVLVKIDLLGFICPKPVPPCMLSVSLKKTPSISFMLKHGVDLQLSLLPSSRESVNQSPGSAYSAYQRSPFPPSLLSIHPFIYPSILPCTHPSFHPSIHLFIHLSTHPPIYPFTSLQLTAVVLIQAASTFLLGGFNSHFTALGALLTAPSSLHHFHSQSQPEWFFCNVDLTMILLCLQPHQVLPMALKSLTFLA